MLTAVVRMPTTDRVIKAEEVLQHDGPFFCVHCGARVIFRQAGYTSPHFAHVINVGCRAELRGGSSPQRLIQELALALAKEAAVSALHQGWLETKRTAPALDFWWDHDQQIAIEVAMGPLPIETIRHRTHMHTQAGMAVLWVVPWKLSFKEGSICAPMGYERYLQELYRGKLFSWSPEQRLHPISYRRLSERGGALKQLHKTYPWIVEKELKDPISPVYRELRLDGPVAFADLKIISYASSKRRRMWLPTATLWTDVSEHHPHQEGGKRHEVDR